MLNKWRLLLSHPEPSLLPSLLERRRHGLYTLSDAPLLQCPWTWRGFACLSSTLPCLGIGDRVESMGILHEALLDLNTRVENGELLYPLPISP